MAATADTGRERDILLAPNEYAYVQDLTKGTIDLNVGPTKVSLSNTERLIEYDSGVRKYVPLEDKVGHFTGVQQFVQASSSQYVVLENPTKDEAKYTKGSNQPVELRTGKKVVMPGPQTFPLWPGQTANVIDGHRLAEDEYLLIRAYDAPEGTQQGNTAPQDKKATELQIGTEQIVMGSETRFYIPQNGWEVVPSSDGIFVRKAVKLMDGEYCVLLKPNGDKKYVNGPSMVIPEPTETFMNPAKPVSKAQTLRPEKGLHLYVTRDFKIEEQDPLATILGQGDYKTGQEIFVQGKDGLFFPNENIEIRGEINPISLAENEGVYVRNIRTGTIRTVTGPKNFLPDPTNDAIVERSLSEKVEGLYKLGARDRKKAISIYIAPNHAVMVISEKERKVVKGPRSHILGYSEDLETLALSTETPKTDKSLLTTAFLQIEGNKVSDIVRVETQDHVKLDVKVSYRLSFDGQPEKWFNVNNYVGLLCDHLSSLVRSGVQRHPLEKFYSNSTEIVRDSILGVKKEGEKRIGRVFDENGMKVYDLEVLNVAVLDETVEDMLTTAQQSAFKLEMSKREAERKFDLAKTTEEITQQTNALRLQSLESELVLGKKDAELKTAQENSKVYVDKIRQLGFAENAVAAKTATYEFEKANSEDEQKRQIELIEKETAAFKERMGAISPQLITAITRYGDQQLIAKAAEYIGPLSALEGKAIIEVANKLFSGLPFASKDLGFLKPLEEKE
jgi:hypothetical protein